MSTAQKLIEQAAPKLIEAAAPRLRAEGRAEGRAAVLKRLVARKFSECDAVALAAAAGRIDAASEAQLESWTDRILFVERLDELFVE